MSIWASNMFMTNIALLPEFKVAFIKHKLHVLVLFELSSAFDAVNHKHVLDTLEQHFGT